jgi:hypothetical protein
MTKIVLGFALLFTLSCGLAGERLKRPTAAPQDVQDWIERHELCEHFGGEAGEGSKSRSISLQLNSHRACFGILDEYQALKRRYVKNKAALQALVKVDVSWLGSQSDLPRGAQLQIEELAARAEMCKDVKNDLDNMKPEEISPDAAQAYGELCMTIDKDRRVLLSKYSMDRKAVQRLKTIIFSP